MTSPLPDPPVSFIEVYDTTLRDGTQGYGMNLSLADKLALTVELDDLGVAFIEGGWPGSNPKDQAFFHEVSKLSLKTAKISAFGATRRKGISPNEDANLQALVASGADLCCIVGKSWDLHIREALRVSEDENLAMIRESVEFLRKQTGRPVFYDAEHFFDGLRENSACTIATVRAAWEAGAERIVLCDTNGGSMPQDISAGIATLRAEISDVALSIHVHNDGGLATANTLAGVEAGCVQVQGTINGIGERCGNVDLTQVIANLELKLGKRCLPEGGLARLTAISRSVWDKLNRIGPDNQAYVGEAAFAHKGGLHVSAMQRNERTYEHVSPSVVGNSRRILMSELAGRSNLLAEYKSRFPSLEKPAVATAILEEVQTLENQGYSFEDAAGSFELLVRRHVGLFCPAFELEYYRVHGIGTSPKGSVEESLADNSLVEATVKLKAKGELKLCAAEGNGPVDALSSALRAALCNVYPKLSGMILTDYKVRVVNSADGAAARVRVLVEHQLDGQRFSTVGVHSNIIEGSWKALVDAVDYGISLGE